MYKKRAAAMFMAGILGVSALTGCSSGGETAAPAPAGSAESAKAEAVQTEEKKTESQAESGEKKVIGFSSAAMEEVFHQNIYEGAQEVAAELGYELILHDSKLSETEMVSGCTNLLDQGVDALIVNPCKPDALGPIVQKAHEMGTPIIIADIDTGGTTDYDLFLISNNYEGGLKAGEYVFNQLEKLPAEENSKKVAALSSRPTNPTGQSRATAFVDYMTEHGYEVVANLTGEDSEEVAYSVMNDIMTANKDLEAVFASGAAMSTSAGMAAHDAGRDDIIVFGFDGTAQEVEAVKNGYISGCMQQFPYYMGMLSVQNADKLIKGEPLEYDDPETKTIFLPTEVIDASNVESISNIPSTAK